MAHTTILLTKPVDNLGGEGDEVRVRAGYARNFLLPRQFAVPMTRANRKQIEALRTARARREAEELDAAKAEAGKLDGVRLAFAVKTGEGGRMFGSVTVQDIQAKLEEQGVSVDRRKILLPAPAKTLGTHSVRIRLHSDVSVELEFEVVSENVVESESETES